MFHLLMEPILVLFIYDELQSNFLKNIASGNLSKKPEQLKL